MDDGSIHDANPTLFEAVITPHRSLSPAGLCIVLAVLTGMTALVSLRFLLLGAWPVVGFNGVETAAVALLLYLNHRSARARELVMLDAEHVRVVRIDTAGRRRERVLPAAWLNVELEENAGRVPRLLLCTRGLREEIGAVLGADEKRGLAGALRGALHEARNPRFDNPQLRAAGDVPPVVPGHLDAASLGKIA
jgi:uncharacterized membrane protein